MPVTVLPMRAAPKKSLGQNFLIDKNIQKKIACACQVSPQDTVIEIGAGTGEITGFLSMLCASVYAVEIDAQLCRQLAENLKGHPNVHIIRQDFLTLDIARLLEGSSGPATVIGNIPYYVTTPIIQHVFSYARLIRRVYLTVQKELAERILAQPG
ncbi:MAG: rRNA adenine dimethyltransferase family protein, partial [Candidatus Omnitrophica bacterium]|nr:rRNA adenine dimethyltransferase family protein [Candidatus Omnitrophota bacterium]